LSPPPKADTNNLCIVAGVLLGNLLPGFFQIVAGWEYASVNLIVAVLIWAMVYPMMVAVDFASLRHIHKRPKGLVITRKKKFDVPIRAQGAATLWGTRHAHAAA